MAQLYIDAAHAPIRLMFERIAHIEWPFMLIAVYQDDRQEKFVGLVQPVENFIARDGDRRLPFGAALDLDMPHGRQLAIRGRWPVAERRC